MAPRKTRAVKPETVENKSTPFLEALKFIGIVTKEQGNINETHVSLSNNCAVAFNGVLAAGVKITEDIYCCPHNKLLIQALSKCGDNMSMTQLDNNRLSIKSGKAKFVVPCVDPSALSMAYPDNPIAPITDAFKESLNVCDIIKPDDNNSMIANSILMNGGSLVSCDRKVIIEHWHGLDLPPGVVLPRAIIQPLVKCSKKLTWFGFSQTSATFWFEDESWIRTQLIGEAWPDLQPLLNAPSNPWATPADLFKGLSTIAPFSEDGIVYFQSGLLRTHRAEGTGASYEVHGLPEGPTFSIKQLMMLEKYATKIDFLAPGPFEGTKMLKFFGDKVRGGIAGRQE